MNAIRDSLTAKLVHLYEDLAPSYEGRANDVLEALAECAEFLRSEDGQLGAWEQMLLDHARAAVEDSFLRLAIVDALKAIQVSTLPEDEYEYGLNYGRRSRAERR